VFLLVRDKKKQQKKKKILVVMSFFLYVIQRRKEKNRYIYIYIYQDATGRDAYASFAHSHFVQESKKEKKILRLRLTELAYR
jgi:hypothetical protein